MDNENRVKRTWIEDRKQLDVFDNYIRLDTLLFRYAEVLLRALENEYERPRGQESLETTIFESIQRNMPVGRKSTFYNSLRDQYIDMQHVAFALPCLGINYEIRTGRDKPAKNGRYANLTTWRRIAPHATHTKVHESNLPFVEAYKIGKDAFGGVAWPSELEIVFDVAENRKHIEECHQCVDWGKLFLKLIRAAEQPLIQTLQYYLSVRSSDLLYVLYALTNGSDADYEVEPDNEIVRDIAKTDHTYEYSFLHKESAVLVENGGKRQIRHIREVCPDKRKFNFLVGGLLLTHICYLQWENDLPQENLRQYSFSIQMKRDVMEEILGRVVFWKKQYENYSIEDCEEELRNDRMLQERAQDFATVLEKAYLNEEEFSRISNAKETIYKIQSELRKAFLTIRRYTEKEELTEEESDALSVYQKMVSHSARMMLLPTENRVKNIIRADDKQDN